MTELPIEWLNLNQRSNLYRIHCPGWICLSTITIIIAPTLSVISPGWCSSCRWYLTSHLDSRSIKWLWIKWRRRYRFITTWTLETLLQWLRSLTKMTYPRGSLRITKTWRTRSRKQRTDIYRLWRRSAIQQWGEQEKMRSCRWRINMIWMIILVSVWEQVTMNKLKILF